jgi:hypothetical protein
MNDSQQRGSSSSLLSTLYGSATTKNSIQALAKKITITELCNNHRLGLLYTVFEWSSTPQIVREKSMLYFFGDCFQLQYFEHFEFEEGFLDDIFVFFVMCV